MANQTLKHLFGKIAANLGFASQDQVNECLVLQRQDPTRGQIGEILCQKGYLTEQQLEEVLATQRDYLRKVEKKSREKVEDSIFGRLVIKNRYATQDQVDEALQEQTRREKEGQIVPIGTILIERRIMTIDQVADILKRQWKQILICDTCSKQFNVFGYKKGKRFMCRKCGNPLRVPEKLTSVRVEGEG